MSNAWVALGSNLADPPVQIERAMLALQALAQTTLVARSRLYQSPPWGFSGQPDFVNAVARLDTRLSARELLTRLQTIESRQGRVRDGTRWGPRSLDLDLLLLDRQQVQDDDLVLPHPHIAQRTFVLLPLLELDPQLDIPGQGRVDELLARLASSECRPLGS